MGSSSTCPTVSGTRGQLLSKYYTHTCAHFYPAWGSPPEAATLRAQKQKNARIEVTWVTLQYMCTMMTKYYCVTLVLHGLNEAVEVRGAKQAFLSFCQYKVPAEYWLQEK